MLPCTLFVFSLKKKQQQQSTSPPDWKIHWASNICINKKLMIIDPLLTTDPSFITWYLTPHSPLPLWADTDPAVTTETDPATPACPPSPPTHPISATPHSTSQLTDTTDSSSLFDSAESATCTLCTPKENLKSDDDINDIPIMPSFSFFLRVIGYHSYWTQTSTKY